MKISWKSLSPIFADIVVSPWNILVGGLLISFLSTWQTIISIVIGYLILSIIFIFYGGLGFVKRKESSTILTSILGFKFGKQIIPLFLAIGQIGWGAINIELGGKSLAEVLPISPIIAIIVYAAILILIASLNLHRQGVVKTLVVFSSIGLILYLFIGKTTQADFSDFIHSPKKSVQSLFWGVSTVVASLISFTTVTPDFFQDVKERKDIVLSTFCGLFLPGITTVILGSFLFFDVNDFNLISLISGLTFPIFPHLFNISTNTDGAVAIYTPGIKFKNMWKVNLRTGIIFAGIISSVLAVMRISVHLEAWLKFLSLFYPAIIGATLTALIFEPLAEEKRFDKNIFISCILAIILSLLTSLYFPPVLLSFMAPTFFFLLLHILSDLVVLN